MTIQDLDTPELLLERWHKRVRESQFAHYEACNKLSRFQYWLGIPAVVLSTLVGTSVFATLQKDASLQIKTATAAASVLVAILAGVQTFLRFGDRAEKHRLAGARYGCLRREIEQFHATRNSQSQDMGKFLNGVREKMDKLVEESLPTPDRKWQNPPWPSSGKSKAHVA